jgi:glycosyltransferase involved in cell wall biosynthesis
VDTKIKELSVFLPIYNEEGNVASVIESTIAAASKYAEKWEILLIDDGSSDNTLKIVTEAAQSSTNIRVIRHEKNLGYGASLKTGFYNSKYDWIAFIDSDGQFDFSEIAKFIEKQKETGADLVIGYYKKRKVSLTKIITSKVWETVVFIFFGLKVHDIDCGFKLISRKVIDKIPKLESKRGAFISSELLIKSKKMNLKFAEVPITHYPRLRGQGTGRKLNVIIESFMDLFKLWIKLK